MILAIDFDGTICIDKYPAIGAPVPYAIDTIQTLHQQGHYIIINTSRDGIRLLEAINWLLAHEIPFDRVNDNHPEVTAKYGSNARKIFADIYIEDRIIDGFPGWLQVYEKIKSQSHSKSRLDRILDNMIKLNNAMAKVAGL